MTLEGKDAEDLMRKLIAEQRQERAEALAKAKAEAAARGKEPFDLAKLERLVDTSRQGRLDPEDERRAQFEEMYYVQSRDILTIADFAEEIRKLNQWS